MHAAVSDCGLAGTGHAAANQAQGSGAVATYPWAWPPSLPCGHVLWRPWLRCLLPCWLLLWCAADKKPDYAAAWRGSCCLTTKQDLSGLCLAGCGYCKQQMAETQTTLSDAGQQQPIYSAGGLVWAWTGSQGLLIGGMNMYTAFPGG